MKNKLFLSLSILTSAFALQASTDAEVSDELRNRIAKVAGRISAELNSVVSRDDVNSKAIASYQSLPAETRFERIRGIADEKYALTKIALANGLTTASNKTVAGYNASKAFVVANPKKSAGIAAGSAALVAATVYLYKKGYLKSPFAKAAKKTEAQSVETKKATPATTPVVKAPAKKAKKQVKTPVVKKESKTRRAINAFKAKFARKK